MTATRDYALTEEHAGVVIVHRADCPDVRRIANAGAPVATLFACAHPPPADLPRHRCLEAKR